MGSSEIGFLQHPVLYQQLEMHFGLAAQAVHRLQEGSAIRPHGAPQGLIGIENSTETERKNSERPEAFADHSGVIYDG